MTQTTYTYAVVGSRIHARDEDELTAIVTIRREDGETREVWACAGIPDYLRGEVAACGSPYGYESAWLPGDAPDCWCPPEFQEDMQAVGNIAEAEALVLWESHAPA